MTPKPLLTDYSTRLPRTFAQQLLLTYAPPPVRVKPTVTPRPAIKFMPRLALAS